MPSSPRPGVIVTLPWIAAPTGLRRAVRGCRPALLRSGVSLTLRPAEQYRGDGRTRQAAAADDREGRARGGGIHNGAAEEVTGGRRDANPAVDVGQDPAKQLRWRAALKVRRHVAVRQRD